jgi:hypothetical protein
MQQQQQPLVYRRNVVVAVLFAVVDPDRPRPTALLPPRSYATPEAAAAAFDRLVMMGINAQNMMSGIYMTSNKPVINCCI